eukprot:c16905_g1_i1.p1 GENE.c16905_g1_i1~~c16905_g1_i1.p1  ORF type:complete len:271 (+),score=29.43 c16905_g1_i1:31-813(+)
MTQDEFDVTVPPGVRGGEVMRVTSPDGEKFDVTVPPGLTAGMVFSAKPVGKGGARNVPVRENPVPQAWTVLENVACAGLLSSRLTGIIDASEFFRSSPPDQFVEVDLRHPFQAQSVLFSLRRNAAKAMSSLTPAASPKGPNLFRFQLNGSTTCGCFCTPSMNVYDSNGALQGIFVLDGRIVQIRDPRNQIIFSIVPLSHSKDKFHFQRVSGHTDGRIERGGGDAPMTFWLVFPQATPYEKTLIMCGALYVNHLFWEHYAI